MMELFHIGDLGFVALTEDLDAESKIILRDLVRHFNATLTDPVTGFKIDVAYNGNRVDITPFPEKVRELLYDKLVSEAENTAKRVEARG